MSTEEAPILEGDKVKRANKPAIEIAGKSKLAAFVETAQSLEHEPLEMKGNKDLKDYAGMNPEAAAVMGWPDKDHAIELDEHQSETVRTKNLVHETVEQEEMKQGETYHDAHLDALKAETTIKTPEHLAEKVQEIRERPAKKGNHPKIVKVHDDGDLTVKKGDTNYVVTTEGKTFKEVTPPPEMKAAIKESKELGEQATQGGATAARGAHNAEVGSSTLPPATNSAEAKVIKEVEAVFNKADKQGMQVRTTEGHWEKDAAGKWHFQKDITTPRIKGHPSVTRNNLYLSVVHAPKIPAQKGSPKPHMSMERKGKMVNIKGVGTANVNHMPKGRVLRKGKSR